jgi:hypothetical protein
MRCARRARCEVVHITGGTCAARCRSKGQAADFDDSRGAGASTRQRLDPAGVIDGLAHRLVVREQFEIFRLVSGQRRHGLVGIGAPLESAVMARMIWSTRTRVLS